MALAAPVVNRTAPAPKPSSPQSTPAASSANSLQAKLQAAVTESTRAMGTLEPWQQVIFDDEVLPQYQRFIRDYKASGSGVKVEVDDESLRNYLRFYAPKALKRENPPIFVLVRADQECEKCTASLDSVKRVIASRVEHRGFDIVWGNPATDKVDAKLSGKGLDDRMSQLAQQKKAAGVLLVDLIPAPVDEQDTAHADELRYLIKQNLLVRDVGKVDGQLDLLEVGSFDKYAIRLMTDAFTQIGEKVTQLEANRSELKRAEMMIEVSGIRGFSQYVELKQRIAEAVRSAGTVHEQKLARGRATFVVYTEKKPEEVKVLLANVKTATERLNFVGAEPVAGDPALQMELK